MQFCWNKKMKETILNYLYGYADNPIKFVLTIIDFGRRC